MYTEIKKGRDTYLTPSGIPGTKKEEIHGEDDNKQQSVIYLSRKSNSPDHCLIRVLTPPRGFANVKDIATVSNRIRRAVVWGANFDPYMISKIPPFKSRSNYLLS